MLTDNLCMGCMRELGEEKVCPHCGLHADFVQESPLLPLRTVINDRYIIGKAISTGGDGVTYIAWDRERNVAVAVREFLPLEHIIREFGDRAITVKKDSSLVVHDGIMAFLELWRKIARLRDLSALKPVVDIVTENNTAYSVSEYIESITLRDFLLKSRTGYLGWDQAKTLLMPVLSTLATMHEAGIYHLGISPNTLLLGRDGKLRLTGFMISDARLTNTDFNAELVKGYVPYEQYDPNGKVGAWSDVYAFTAVVYRTLIGSIPDDSNERVVNDKLLIPAKFAEVLPAYLVSAIHNGLQLQPEDRIRTVDDLREQLSGSPSTMATNKIKYETPIEDAPQKQDQPTTTADEEAERKRREKLRREQERKQEQTKTLLITFGICVAIGLVVLGGWLFATREKAQKDNTTPTEEVSLVSVPNFAGQSYTRISTDEVQNQRFKITAKYEYNNKVNVGYIISQSIEEGQQVPYGTELVLTVSKGTEYIDIPDVSGKDYAEAEKTLTDAGFTVKKVEKSNDGTHQAGKVIASTPSAGTSAESGSEVYLQVWGAAPTTTSASTTKSSNGFGIDIPRISDIF